MVGGAGNPLLAQAWSSGASTPMGVEKNPWCMPYMYVQAQTSPRKIFSPFGDAITLNAESVAKPFGGRIGPWYNKSWPSGSATSQGGEKVDPLLPAREVVGGGSTPGDPADDLVNYSKYPGDKLGLNSGYALAAMHTFWNSNVTQGRPPTNLMPAFALSHFSHLGDPVLFRNSPESLARANGAGPDVTPIRHMEEAAVAPDLFDITYYSIEGQYSYNYFHPSLPDFRSFIPTDNVYLDIGSSNRSPYSVVNQVGRSNQLYSSQPPFYMVDNPSQMLTGWTQNKAVDYSFPQGTFGRCMQRRDDEMEATPGPGGCPHGGRSGYSVKIVSRKYLKEINAPLGGPSTSGPILNALEN